MKKIIIALLVVVAGSSLVQRNYAQAQVHTAQMIVYSPTSTSTAAGYNWVPLRGTLPISWVVYSSTTPINPSSLGFDLTLYGGSGSPSLMIGSNVKPQWSNLGNNTFSYNLNWLLSSSTPPNANTVSVAPGTVIPVEDYNYIRIKVVDPVITSADGFSGSFAITNAPPAIVNSSVSKPSFGSTYSLRSVVPVNWQISRVNNSAAIPSPEYLKYNIYLSRLGPGTGPARVDLATNFNPAYQKTGNGLNASYSFNFGFVPGQYQLPSPDNGQYVVQIELAAYPYVYGPLVQSDPFMIFRPSGPVPTGSTNQSATVYYLDKLSELLKQLSAFLH